MSMYVQEVNEEAPCDSLAHVVKAGRGTGSGLNNESMVL